MIRQGGASTFYMTLGTQWGQGLGLAVITRPSPGFEVTEWKLL